MKKSLFIIAISLLTVGCATGNSSQSSVSSDSMSSLSETSSQSSVSSTDSSSRDTSSQGSTSSKNPDSSETTSQAKPIELTEALLNKYASGVKAFTITSEKVNGVESVYAIQTASKNKMFSAIQYEDKTKTKEVYHENYAGKENDNFVYSYRLDMSNTYNYHKVYNATTSEYFTFDDGFDNVFKYLTVNDFTNTSVNEYALTKEALAKTNVQNNLSSFIYGNPGIVIKNFTFIMEGNEVRFVASSEPFIGASSTYEYSFTGSIIASGDDVTIDHRIVPFDPVEDKIFEDMITSLKNYNFVAHAVNKENGVEVDSSTYYSNADKIFYEFSTGENCGFYLTSNSKVQEVVKKDNVFYKVNEEMEGSLSEIQASFNLNRACFDKNENTYTLKKSVEGDILTTIYPLEISAEEAAELSITINNDNVVFKNVSGKYETEITFSNIGNADVGFDETTVQVETTASWNTILSEVDFNFTANVMGSENLTALPVPEGYESSAWVQFSEEPEYAMLISEKESTTIDDDIYAYALQLEGAGYTLQESAGQNGGALFTKMLSVAGSEVNMSVEILSFEGLFTIVIMPLL